MVNDPFFLKGDVLNIHSNNGNVSLGTQQSVYRLTKSALKCSILVILNIISFIPSFTPFLISAN